MTQTRGAGSDPVHTSGTRPTTTQADVGRAVRDDRGFYRTALAVVAPLPMAVMGLTYLLMEMPGDGSFQDMVDAAARQPGLFDWIPWLHLLWFGFLIPAVIAVAAVTRRTSPRLTAVGIALTVPGFGTGFAGPNDTLMAYLSQRDGLDVTTVGKLDDALWGLPYVGVGSLLFIVGIVIGLLLLGIALARSGAVPVFFGVALAVGGFTHPFLSPLGHVVTGLGLWVAAVGFAGASIALLRMGNDDFAPAPTGR
jgi:hypothetical protein